MWRVAMPIAMLPAKNVRRIMEEERKKKKRTVTNNSPRRHIVASGGSIRNMCSLRFFLLFYVRVGIDTGLSHCVCPLSSISLPFPLSFFFSLSRSPLSGYTEQCIKQCPNTFFTTILIFIQFCLLLRISLLIEVFGTNVDNFPAQLNFQPYHLYVIPKMYQNTQIFQWKRLWSRLEIIFIIRIIFFL